jgi:hypothetical protein
MLPSLAHLSNAAGAPPDVRLGVDEDRRASWVAIGNPLCRNAVDVMLGGRKSVRFALPKGEDRGATPRSRVLVGGKMYFSEAN